MKYLILFIFLIVSLASKSQFETKSDTIIQGDIRYVIKIISSDSQAYVFHICMTNLSSDNIILDKQYSGDTLHADFASLYRIYKNVNISSDTLNLSIAPELPVVNWDAYKTINYTRHPFVIRPHAEYYYWLLITGGELPLAHFCEFYWKVDLKKKNFKRILEKAKFGHEACFTLDLRKFISFSAH